MVLDFDPLIYWSSKVSQNLSLATVEQYDRPDIVNMNHFEFIVMRKTRIAIEGKGRSELICNLGRQNLERDLGLRNVITNTQLRHVHADPFIKPFD